MWCTLGEREDKLATEVRRSAAADLTLARLDPGKAGPTGHSKLERPQPSSLWLGGSAKHDSVGHGECGILNHPLICALPICTHSRRCAERDTPQIRPFPPLRSRNLEI
jgi:hypothetical protein